MLHAATLFKLTCAQPLRNPVRSLSLLPTTLTWSEPSSHQGVTVHLAKTTLNEVHDVSLGLEVECRYLSYYVFVWFPLNSNEEKQDNDLQNGSNDMSSFRNHKSGSLASD